jgi:hypothetical protein
MEAPIKFLVFFFVFAFAAIISYKAYTFFNNRIIESRTGWQLLVYSLSLIAINLILFFGGALAVLKLIIFLGSK